MRKEGNHELSNLKNDKDDVTDDWREVLDRVFKLVEGLKVPGRKSKSYDQNIFRTMIFKRVTTEFIVIDGHQYEVSNSVNLDHWDCKEKFLGLITKIEEGIEDEPFTPDNLASWKKDFVNKLKDFEKKYIRHAK